MASPIVISILANSRGAVTGIGSVRGSLTKLALPLTAAGVGLAVFGKKAVSAASDAQQSMGATETVFGKSAKTVIATSKKAAKEYGLSANVYRENANLIGSLLKNQGVTQDKLAGKTKKMIGTASDLAATFGGTTTQAVEALSSALKGEFDPLEKYGISLKQSTVNSEAMRVAHVGNAAAFGKLTAKQQAAAKQQATNNLIMKQSKDSMGAFGKETNTFAHQTQVLGAQWENFKATLGTYLLPVLTKTISFISKNAPDALAFLQAKLGPVITSVRGFFDGINTGSGQAGDILTQFGTTASSALENVKSIFTSAVSIITSLWQRFGADLTRYAVASLQNLLTFIRGALNVIAGIFKVVSSLLKGDWSGAWDGIKQIVKGALQVVTAVVRQGANAIRTAFSIGLKALTSIVSGVFGGLASAASAGGKALLDYVRGIPASIKGLLSGAKTLLYDVGGQIIDGLVQGIKDGFHKVTDVVGDLAGKVKGGLKGALSIFSPSRVTRQLGRYVSQGLALGMLDGSSGITSAVNSLAKIVNEQLPKRIKKPKAVAQWYAEHKKAIAAGTADVLKALKASARQQLAQAKAQRAEYAAAVTDAAKQYASLGNLSLGDNETLSATKIAQFYRDRLAGIRNFNAKLAAIKNRVTSSVYDEIVRMGVDQGTAYADALAGASPQALSEINSLSTQINSASNALGTNTAQAMYGAGVQSAQGYYDGLQTMLRKIEKQGGKIAKSLVKALKKALGIKSPSRVMRALGKFSIEGLNDGLDTKAVQDQGRALAKSLVKGYATPKLEANPRLDAQLAAGFAASGPTKVTNNYNIEVRFDNTMTEPEMGAAYKKAIKAAESLGIA